MGRYYHFSKVVTDAELTEIVKEMKEVDDVDIIEITKDHSYMKVVTKDNQFTEAMGKAVNICSRVAGGLEISFARFSFE